MRANSSLLPLLLGGWLLLWLLWPVPLHAQESSDDALLLHPVTDWLSLSVDEGLPSATVSAIRQDKQGFIWLGTRGGLSRFDGQEVVTYRHDPTDANSLASNSVHDILVDRTGQIWVATAGAAVSRLDPATDTFTRYTFEPDNSNSLGGPLVTSLYEDRAGNLWFGGPRGSGLTRLEPATGRFTRYYPQPRQPNGYEGELVGEMHEDSAGHLWFVADTSLVEFDPTAERFTSYRPAEAERRLNSLVPAPDGGWWVAGLRGLYHFDPADGSFEVVEGKAGPLAQLFLTEGTLWLGSRTQGLYEAEPTTGRVRQHHAPRSALVGGFPGESVTALFEDAGGVLWVGSASAGAIRTLLLADRFESYRYDPTKPEALALSGVSALSGADAMTLWLGAGNSLQRLDRTTGSLTRYPLPTAQQRIEAVHVDRAGVVWVGTATPDGLYRLDPAVGQLEPFEIPDTRPQQQPPRLMVAIEETPDGALWVAAQRDALYRLDPDREGFTRYEPNQSLAALLPPGAQAPDIRSLASAPDGTLWIGYSADAITQREPSGRFHHLLLERKVGTIVDMQVAADGGLWLVSTLLGLLHGEPEGAVALPLGEETALAAQSIEVDEAGWLWLGTHNGLVRYDPAQGTIERFVKHDGLQGNQFSSGAAWRAPNGWLFFGGTDGLTAFDPRLIAPDSFQPRAVLTMLRRYNEPVVPKAGGLLEQALWATERLSLAHHEDVITFEFAGLGYADPAQLRYRYRLDGFEAAWNEVGNRRFATYTNLPAGSYEFQVQVSNHDGQWSDQSAWLALVVQPPWWETVWFRGGAAIVLLLAGAAGYHWRVRAMRQRTLDLEAEVTRRTEELTEQRARVAALEERERIGRDLHDDLGQIIGYVAIQAQSARALLDQQATSDEIGAILTQLVEATGLAHDNVRQYILGIRQATKRSGELLASLEAYVAHLATEWGIQVHLSYPDALREQTLTPAVEMQLLRIVQEALTNVRKHAGVSHAQVLFSLHPDSVQAIITDQGRGFDLREGEEAQESAPHFGLLIMQERAASLGGEVEVRSTPGAGTQLFVRLPRLLPATLREEARGVRVLLADDHPLYLEGLHTLLSTRGFHVVGRARDGVEAQELVAQFRPELVLMDVEMPRCDGLEATQHIKAAYPETKIIMLTVAATEERLFGALRAGASGYLLKRLDVTQFFTLLGEVLRGEVILSPSLASQVLEAFDAEDTAPTDEPPELMLARARLTTRQREVLTHLAQGLSNREIAEALYVTEPTIKYHVSQILERLQVATRQEAARYAAPLSKREESA